MKLHDDWPWIIRRAWSIRLILMAGLLSGLEAAMAWVTPGLLGIPQGAFAALSGAVTMAALVARVVMQRRG